MNLSPASHAADVPTELDRLLDEHKKQQAATAAARLPDNMPLGQRMRYELINSFLQVKQNSLSVSRHDVWVVMQLAMQAFHAREPSQQQVKTMSTKGPAALNLL
jgi:formate dehydrogenase maturation protein FdhE